jgi:hypothetical protein
MIILANAYKTKPRSEGDDENIHQISPDGRRHSIFYQTSATGCLFCETGHGFGCFVACPRKDDKKEKRDSADGEA